MRITRAGEAIREHPADKVRHEAYETRRQVASPFSKVKTSMKIVSNLPRNFGPNAPRWKKIKGQESVAGDWIAVANGSVVAKQHGV